MINCYLILQDIALDKRAVIDKLENSANVPKRLVAIMFSKCEDDENTLWGTVKRFSIYSYYFIIASRCLVSCFLFLVSCFLFLVSCFLFLVSCFLFLVSCFLFLVSCFLFLVFILFLFLFF